MTDISITTAIVYAEVQSSAAQAVSVSVPLSTVAQVSAAGIQGPVGPQGPQGPAGSANASDIGGYPITITSPSDGDYLGFYSLQWVNSNVTDGGNF